MQKNSSLYTDSKLICVFKASCFLHLISMKFWKIQEFFGFYVFQVKYSYSMDEYKETGNIAWVFLFMVDK